MKFCPDCGRQNTGAQETCPGCGNDLSPAVFPDRLYGIIDPITPRRRCHCKGVMRYYRPAPGRSTCLRPYAYRYLCGQCGKRAIVTPYDQRGCLIPISVIGGAAGLCLYFFNPLENIERDGFKTKWVVIAVLAVVFGLVAGHLALLTAWNRRRYPIIEDPTETPRTDGGRL